MRHLYLFNEVINIIDDGLKSPSHNLSTRGYLGIKNSPRMMCEQDLCPNYFSKMEKIRLSNVDLVG